MKIKIEQLSVRTQIGVYEQEQNIRQELLIDLEINFDSTSAVLSDKLSNTLDYNALCNEIIDTVETQKFGLIEKVADIIAKIVLEKEKVFEVVVKVSKPNALAFATSVAIIHHKQKIK